MQPLLLPELLFLLLPVKAHPLLHLHLLWLVVLRGVLQVLAPVLLPSSLLEEERRTLVQVLGPVQVQEPVQVQVLGPVLLLLQLVLQLVLKLPKEESRTLQGA